VASPSKNPKTQSGKTSEHLPQAKNLSRTGDKAEATSDHESATASELKSQPRSEAGSADMLGTMMEGAGLATRENLDSALKMSKVKKQPLGRVLMENGLVTEKELYATLQAQNLIREKLLSMDMALDVLRRIRSHGDSFVNNLMAVGCTIEPIVFGVTLGRLFIDAGVITSQMLDEAMETSLLSGLPLVRVLVLQQSLTEMVAYSGLTAFLLLKQKRIGRDQAVGALKLASMHNEQIEEILEFGGLKRYRSHNLVRLGELLVISELISELDLLSCVERTLSEAKPLGQVLVDEGIASEQMVGYALRAQKYIQDGTVDPVRAGQMLKECAATGRPLELSMEELAAIKPIKLKRGRYKPSPSGFVELLNVVGLIKTRDIEQVRLVAERDSDAVDDYLLKRNILDVEKLAALKLGYKLVEAERMTVEQLIFVLHVWLWSRGDFTATLSMLGYKAS
jgi:hypothetical protein